MTEKQEQFSVIRYGGGPRHGGHKSYTDQFHTFCGLWYWTLGRGIELGQGEVQCRNCLRTVRYDAARQTKRNEELTERVGDYPLTARDSLISRYRRGPWHGGRGQDARPGTG